jgi:hypothetical protein
VLEPQRRPVRDADVAGGPRRVELRAHGDAAVERELTGEGLAEAARVDRPRAGERAGADTVATDTSSLCRLATVSVALEVTVTVPATASAVETVTLSPLSSTTSSVAVGTCLQLQAPPSQVPPIGVVKLQVAAPPAGAANSTDTTAATAIPAALNTRALLLLRKVWRVS